jgi:hypothetical protein
MPGPISNPQWYLARDGQQYGPISEAEMAKFVELGHLQSTDLLWREGFPDWRPAMVVFPPRGPQLPHGAAHGPSMAHPGPDRSPRLTAGPRTGAAPRAASYHYQDEPRAAGGLARVAALGVLVVALAGIAALAYPYRTQVMGLIASYTAYTAPSGAMGVSDRKSLETPPLVGFRAGSLEAVDKTLQTTALWRVIKREFPDWYTQRLNEAAALAREDKSDAVIGQFVARKLAELRRQQVANGLSATMERLKTVAVAYLEVLTRLRAQSPETCSGLIRQGEADPGIVALLQGSEQTAYLQALSTVIFEAIAEGRQLPRVHPRPTQAHHAMLASDLAKRGWTQDDFRILSNEQAMAQAPPEKVCQLVQDLFAAQLSLPDTDAQLRLLVDSLRPVFSG